MNNDDESVSSIELRERANLELKQKISTRLVELERVTSQASPQKNSAVEPMSELIFPKKDINLSSYASFEYKSNDAPTAEIKAFHNKFKGRRCFIVGNGPSLNKHDLSLLDGEVVFAVNSFYYKTRETGFVPTFFVVEDLKVMEENYREFLTYEVPYKFFPLEYKAFHPPQENVFYFRMNHGFYQNGSAYFNVPRFSVDATRELFCGQSVTYINLQLAFFMGFTEVYLIGMDFDYVVPKEHVRRGNDIISTTDDPNHFHKDYFGKGKTWRDPKLDRVALNYRQAKLTFEAVGRRIYNATVGGKLEIFPRVDYESLLRDPASGKKRREPVVPQQLTAGEAVSAPGDTIPSACISVALPSRPVERRSADTTQRTPAAKPRTAAELRAARWAKLKRDPHGFFRDSRVPALRPLKFFFHPAAKKKWEVEAEARSRPNAERRFGFLPASRNMIAAERAASDAERRASDAILRQDLAAARRATLGIETELRSELTKLREALSKQVNQAQLEGGAQFGKEIEIVKAANAALAIDLRRDIADAASSAELALSRSAAVACQLEDLLAAYRSVRTEVDTLRHDHGEYIRSNPGEVLQKAIRAAETVLQSEMSKHVNALATTVRSDLAKALETLAAENSSLRADINSMRDNIEKAEKQAAGPEITALKAAHLKDRKLSNYSNATFVRAHERFLSAADIEHIRANWLRLLGLDISSRQLSYIAHQICLSEERCEGRMATTIQAAMLRTLALLSLQSKQVEMLEIGTLFGIAAGTLYRAGARAGRDMRLTLIDPLDGYYGQSIKDHSTGVPVTPEMLTHNLRMLSVPDEHYRVIQHLSTDAAAIEAAAERRYDFVLIDGDHSIEGVAADFEIYGPMVKPGGVLIFDDYDTVDWPAIKPFVDEHVRPSGEWLWIGGEWRTAIFRRKRGRVDLTRAVSSATTETQEG